MTQIQQLEQIYAKAWGQTWPNQSGFVNLGSRFPDDPSPEERYEDLLEEDDPRSLSYTSLLDIDSLCETLQVPISVLPRLLVRKEFEFLLGELEARVRKYEEEKREGGFGVSSKPCSVVTGHSGIGKTMFLIYILLHRLSLQLPTAFQATPDKYVLFDEEGVSVFPAHEVVDRLQAQEMWCLCASSGSHRRNGESSNSGAALNVDIPCAAFLSSNRVVVQTTTAPMKVWESWQKQKFAEVIYMDLPNEVEVAGIIQEANLPLPQILPIFRKWGPTLTTILDLYHNPTLEKSYERKARQAARRVYQGPGLEEGLLAQGGKQLMWEEASTIFFLRPVRGKTDEGKELGLSQFILEMSTTWLAMVFNAERTKRIGLEGIRLGF